MFNLLYRFSLAAAWVGYFVGMAAAILMMFHIGIDTAYRALLGKTLIGTIEITSNWYMVSLVFGPLALIQLRNEHICVDVFTQALPPRMLACLESVVGLMGIAVLGYWFTSAFSEALKKTARWEAIDVVFMHIPVWPMRWVYAISLAILLLAFITTTIRFFLVTIGRAPEQACTPIPTQET